MVLQRPVACEQHASAAPWSAMGDASEPRRLEAWGRSDELSRDSPDGGPPNVPGGGERVELFSGAEYQRLLALRAKVRARSLGGNEIDDSSASHGQIDGGTVPRQ